MDAARCSSTDGDGQTGKIKKKKGTNLHSYFGPASGSGVSNSSKKRKIAQVEEVEREEEREKKKEKEKEKEKEKLKEKEKEKLKEKEKEKEKENKKGREKEKENEKEEEKDKEEEKEREKEEETIEELGVDVQVTSEGENTAKDGNVSQCVKETGVFNNDKPHQPVISFPFRKFGTQNRRFQKSWYEDFKWLEYNEKEDKSYCFPCRVFLPKTCQFNNDGHADWKNAMGGSLRSHDTNLSHVEAMRMWADRDNRQQSSSTIIHKITNTPEHKQWLEVVFLLIKSLVKNGLPLRGHHEHTDFAEEVSGGLYLNLINDLVFKLRPDLVDIAKKLPKHAKYTSPDVQNEVISVLKDIVEHKISKQIAEGELYTLMVDGTTDKSNDEIVSIVCRYIVEGDEDIEVVEHLVHMEESEDRCANALLELVSRSLKQVNVSLDGLVSQCYDGASVMSGEDGGLQALLSDFCKRFIVYIHCFCHRLHLAVESILENIEDVSQYFSTVTTLYAFFKKASIRTLYDGTRLKRLLTTRWSGHRDATERLKENYSNILQCLQTAAGVISPSSTTSARKKIEASDVALATGLATMISDDVRIFLTFIIHEILEIVDIGNKILQSRGDQNIVTAITTIKSVNSNVKELITRYPDDPSIIHAVNQSMDIKITSEIDNGKWKRSAPKKLIDDFLVTEHLPSESSPTTSRKLRPLLVMMVDLLTSELDERFHDKNTSLWESMEALMPSAKNFLDPVCLSKLFDYALTVPIIARKLDGKSFANLRSECQVFKVPLAEVAWDIDPSTKSIDFNKVASYVIKHFSKAAVILTQLYKLSVVAGYASVTNECSFSALQQIDSPRRRSMTPYRECNLTFLYFEKEFLSSVTFEEFLSEWFKKPRRFEF